jgi:hypothetical protein
MMQIGNSKNAEVEENMLRHMILNSLRSYKQKYSEEYGKIVIACDNKNYWRKQIFPFYKANRKKSRDESGLDWRVIFESLHKIRSEIKEYFPYTVIEIETAEADDVIASLCKKFGVLEETMAFEQVEKILILSGDKDFIQLQKYKNVSQYDPVRKKTITHPNPSSYLREHIIRGDVGDGVPNFLSSDNCLVIGERQKSVTEKKLNDWLKQEPKMFCTEVMLRNFKRNEQLIDLSFVPEELYVKITESYEQQKNKKSNNLMNYFMVNNLKNLTENIGDFV